MVAETDGANSRMSRRSPLPTTWLQDSAANFQFAAHLRGQGKWLEIPPKPTINGSHACRRQRGRGELDTVVRTHVPELTRLILA